MAKDKNKKPFNVLSKKGFATLALAGVMAVSPFMLVGCGEAGPKGDTGAQGATGAAGKSAYELAVDNGFEGTLQEWLDSLKGETGATGTQGPQGEQGVQGETGPQGATGATGPQGVAGKDGTDGAVLNNASFMHISFDDVEKCFTNIKNNSYDSLYDEPFFNWLKSMHDTYGAKFSLYAYNNSLTSVPNTYADEFLVAKDWLKIGLHADSSSTNYGSSTYEQGKTAWNTFVNNVVRITGSYLSVDRMPRLHTFAGSEEALKGMRDANYGAIGFLSADDARNSYYFDQDTTDYLYYNDHITDHKNGLTFVATDLRADWFEGTSAGNEYREPTQTSVYDELVERYTNVEYANSVSSYIFFGHEWLIYDGTTLDSGKQYFEDACKFAQDYDIGFDFSQNKAFNPTSNDIYPEVTTTGGEDDQEPEVTTVMYYDTEMQIVDSISEMTFDGNYAPPGGASNDFNDSGIAGRATCITAVLAVNGGETINFASNLEEIFGSTNLSFALIEFASAPLSKETMSFPNVNSGSATTEQKAACAYAWLTEAHTLQTNTRYVILAFKNGDGSVDFTAEQLQALSQCLIFS